jgi:meso-butanediol dehydrogenase/(S,S)-butanediol dehydrogenase/diacetyl reductase
MTPVVLITGGTSGIGAATARVFAEAGSAVVITGRNEAAGAALVAALGAESTGFVRADLCDPAAGDTLVDHAVARFGRLDVLVNNAGIGENADATETTDALWRRHMTVNLDAAFYLSRAAVRRFRAQGGGGVIVNVSSEYGLVGAASFVAYCASKGGMILMTRAMALDHAGENIRINAVCPGGVDTPMLEALANQRGQTAAEARREWAASSPNGRVATPEDVAHAIAFLASPRAGHINGVVLPVDGGSSAR